MNDTEKAVRGLFADHGIYVTWLIKTAKYQNSHAKKVITDRLLRNPRDFNEALVPFVGNEVAQQFEDALVNHLMLVSTLTQLILNGGYPDEISQQEDQIYLNGDRVADFVSSLNPSVLPQDVAREVFSKYNQYILNLVFYKYIEKNWEMFILTFDEFRSHLMVMAEAVYNILV